MFVDEVLTTNAIYDSSDNQPLASKQTVRPSDCGMNDWGWGACGCFITIIVIKPTYCYRA